MGVLFSRLPVSPATCDLLRGYAFRTGSASAMRMLLGRFADRLPAQDVQLLQRLLAERAHAPVPPQA